MAGKNTTTQKAARRETETRAAREEAPKRGFGAYAITLLAASSASAFGLYEAPDILRQIPQMVRQIEAEQGAQSYLPATKETKPAASATKPVTASYQPPTDATLPQPEAKECHPPARDLVKQIKTNNAEIAKNTYANWIYFVRTNTNWQVSDYVNENLLIRVLQSESNIGADCDMKGSSYTGPLQYNFTNPKLDHEVFGNMDYWLPIANALKELIPAAAKYDVLTKEIVLADPDVHNDVALQSIIFMTSAFLADDKFLRMDQLRKDKVMAEATAKESAAKSPAKIRAKRLAQAKADSEKIGYGSFSKRERQALIALRHTLPGVMEAFLGKDASKKSLLDLYPNLEKFILANPSLFPYFNTPKEDLGHYAGITNKAVETYGNRSVVYFSTVTLSEITKSPLDRHLDRQGLKMTIAKSINTPKA